MAWPQVEQRMCFRSPAASWSGRLLGGFSPLCGSFAKRCSRRAALFRLGSSTGGSCGLLLGFVLVGCLSGILVVRVHLDRLFVPLGKLLGFEGIQ